MNGLMCTNIHNQNQTKILQKNYNLIESLSASSTNTANATAKSGDYPSSDGRLLLLKEACSL